MPFHALKLPQQSHSTPTNPNSVLRKHHFHKPRSDVFVAGIQSSRRATGDVRGRSVEGVDAGYGAMRHRPSLGKPAGIGVEGLLESDEVEEGR